MGFRAFVRVEVLGVRVLGFVVEGVRVKGFRRVAVAFFNRVLGSGGSCHMGLCSGRYNGL